MIYCSGYGQTIPAPHLLIECRLACLESDGQTADLRFLPLLALTDRNRWLDTAWVFGGLVFGVIACVFSMTKMCNRGVPGE